MDAGRLAGFDEITLRTRHRDGVTASRPVWVVLVDGDAYVRAVFGPRTAWYRSVERDPRVELAAGGETIAAALRPASGAVLDERVSDAYRAKYGERWPADTETIVGDAARATTLRVEPAVQSS